MPRVVRSRSRPGTRQVSRWLTGLFLLLGIVGLVVGIGVGVRWLRAGVLTWESALAGLALFVGTVCVGLGVARLGRGLSVWARGFVRGLATSLLAVVIWTLTPAVIATVVPPTNRTATPAEYGLDARDVRFATSEGVELAGWYVPSTDEATIILRHGSGSTASAVLPQARVLVSNGYGVLITDARGHGQSGGRAMDFGWNGDSDIEAALTFLLTQPEVDPGRIVVMGMSMGGEEAIGAASADRRVAAVVAEGATARTDEDKRWFSDAYGWRGWVQLRLEWVQYAVTDMLTDSEKPGALAWSVAEADPTPILLITAGNAPDEAKAARYLRDSGETCRCGMFQAPITSRGSTWIRIDGSRP